ncbi:MAG: glycine cleavage system aminomethyltransferase GcvT [Pseudomonadales bacterium]|jgi:aminomethyltransferase
MSRETALHATHVAAGARMVDFAGWDMPLNYGSQIEEHNAVRSGAGMFDVSHMTVIDLPDDSARPFLRRLVANDVDKLDTPGKALYGVLLNDAGGVVDDLIVYRRASGYRTVVNAGTREKVLDWFAGHNDEGTAIHERDLAMIAVQGPDAVARFEAVRGEEGAAGLAPFSMLESGEVMIARTGYTGEDGVEVILPGDEAVALWEALAAAGVVPAGLAARDTLRLEAGLNLYGQDMDETTSPLVSNLAWTVDWGERAFIGRAALEAEKAAGVAEKLTGLVMTAKGVLRHGQKVISADGDGVITSGVFSPTLGYAVALARIPRTARGMAEVEIRGRRAPVAIVRPPFVRNGKRVYKDPTDR